METRERIMQSAIKCTGLYGLGEVRTRRIAQDCGLSEANIYRFFSGKDELLQACYDTIDSRIAAFCRRMAAAPAEETFRVRWGRLFRYLLRHPEDTVFYYHFHASMVSVPRAGPTAKAGAVMSALLPGEWSAAAEGLRQVYTDYLLHNSVYFAFQVLSGGLEDGQETEDRISKLIYCGIGPAARAENRYREETA